MERKVLFLLLIVILASFVRFYKLGDYPPISPDATAVAYNAFSILKTGKDEFGVKFPVFFKSFGEGKLPLYVYEAVPFIALFGLNEFAVRFFPALAGTLTVLVLYFFTKEVIEYCQTKYKLVITNKSIDSISLLAVLILATMPWHIHFSREIFGQESLFWALLGSLLTIKFLKRNEIKYLILGLISFSASLMTYHNAKIFIPLWIAYILILKLRTSKFKQVFKFAIIALLISGSCWIWMSTSELGQARVKDMSVFSRNNNVFSRLWKLQILSQGQPVLYTRFLHNKVEAYGRDILERYFSHFEPTFLFFKGDMLRDKHRVPEVGQLLLIFLPFLIIGTFGIFRYKLWPILYFLLISPLAASFSFETPSAVRAIFMTVPISIMCALGIWMMWNNLKGKPILFKFIFNCFILLFFVHNFVFFLNSSFVLQKFYNAHDWKYGTKEIVKDITEKQNDYKNVVITSQMSGNPYIYFLFYNKYDPTKWQLQANDHIEDDKGTSFIHIRQMDNLLFVDKPCVLKNEISSYNLYLCKTNTLPEGLKAIKTYFYPNGEESFVLAEVSN